MPCDAELSYQNRFRFNADYTLPWYGIQVAGVYQDLPGVNYSATLTYTSAQINGQPVGALGRPLLANTVTLDLLQPFSGFGPRVRQLDLRGSKIFRLGGSKRFLVSVDLYNLTNSSTPVFYRTGYTAPGAVTTTPWLQPTQIMDGRFVRFSAQFDLAAPDASRGEILMARTGLAAHVTRRDLLRLLGAGAAAGTLEHATGLMSAPLLQTAGSVRSITVPRGAIVRTILEDVDPNTMGGATLMHEHLGNGRRPPARGQRGDAGAAANSAPDNPTQDVDWMTVELKAARQAGVGCIVSAQTGIGGVDVTPYLTTLSERTGLHLLNAGAYYTKQTYPSDFSTKSEDEIADGLVQASRTGRFGAFGEFGVANGEADLDPIEKKVFRAVGKAHVRTGLPIFTHNNYSTGPEVSPEIALRQLDQLEAVGVDPSHVAIGHVCCLDDPKADVASRLAGRGAFVAFDRVTRQQQWVSDEHRIMMIMSFLEAGHIDRLVLSSDYIGRVNTAVGEISVYPGPLHARDGGPGYARPLVLFVPRMRQAGIKDEDIRRITEDNPRRFLAFVPRTA